MNTGHKLAVTFFLGLLAAAPTLADDRVCTVLIPEKTVLEQTAVSEQCDKGYACELEACEGWLVVSEGSAQVVFRSKDNRSEIVDVKAGDRLLLSELDADNSVSSAIRALLDALSGKEPESAPGGRYALQPGAAAGGVPSGQIAVFDEGLSFSVPDAPPGAVYVFHPQDDSASAIRVIAEDSVFRIAAQHLPAGQRFRGGLEGGVMVPFQVSAQSKLDRVRAELEATSGLSDLAAAYRRVLIFLDNGLSWNGRGALEGLQGGH